jgi:uncharacterized membrane protein
MTETFRSPLLLLATLSAGLQAGTYYTWANAVMPGLARTDARTFVTAFNQMNHAIVNPLFMLTFLGTPVLAAGALATSTPAARPWVVGGLVLALGTVAITIAANVPLNDTLDKLDGVRATAADLTAGRADFESAWRRWNVVRAITSAGALAAFGWAALRS